MAANGGSTTRSRPIRRSRTSSRSCPRSRTCTARACSTATSSPTTSCRPATPQAHRPGRRAAGSTTTSPRSTAPSAIQAPEVAEVGPSVACDIFTDRPHARGARDGVARVPVDVRRRRCLPSTTPHCSSATTRCTACWTRPPRQPRRPLPVRRRDARPAARRAAREVVAVDTGVAAAARLQPVGAVRRARPATARPRVDGAAGVRVDRSDPSATWLAGVSVADGAQRLQVLEQAPEQTRRGCSWPRIRARRSTPRCSRSADEVDQRRPHRQPVGVARRSGCPAWRRWPDRTSKRRRRRSTPCSARCQASSRRSSRWRWPARGRRRAILPSSSTQSVPRLMPTTSRRPRSVWPELAGTRGDVTGEACRRSTWSRRPSAAYVAARRRRAELLDQRRAGPG